LNSKYIYGLLATKKKTFTEILVKPVLNDLKASYAPDKDNKMQYCTAPTAWLLPALPLYILPRTLNLDIF